MPPTYAAASPIRKVTRWAGGVRPVSWLLARVSEPIDLAVYRATGGRHTLLELLSGLPIVMLTTTGARSCRRVTVPLIATRAGDRYVVVASNYGRPHHPAWYHNLIVNPRATVTVDGAEIEVIARLTTGEERRRLLALDAMAYPARLAYQRRAAGRQLGVFSLEPIASSSAAAAAAAQGREATTDR